MISEIIASGIQVILFVFGCQDYLSFFSMKPLQNMSVLKRVGEEKKAEWAHHYIKLGLDGKPMNQYVIFISFFFF
jgi:hypothetical protein